MILLVARGLNAQTSLALSSAEIISGEPAILDLSLTAGDLRPAALEWIFQLNASDISRFTVDDGPALAAAGKTVICSGDAGFVKCLVVGLNQEMINDGVIAKVTVVLGSGAHTTTIQISDAVGASRDGDPVPVSSTTGTIRGIDPPSERRSRSR